MNDGVCLSDYWFHVCGKATSFSGPGEAELLSAFESMVDYDETTFYELLTRRCTLLHGLGTQIALPDHLEAAVVFAGMPPETAREVWAMLGSAQAGNSMLAQMRRLPVLPREFRMYAWRSFCERLDIDPRHIVTVLRNDPAKVAKQLRVMLESA